LTSCDEDAAAQELKEIGRNKEQIANALQLRLAYVDKPKPLPKRTRTIPGYEQRRRSEPVDGANATGDLLL
jgi:hypothetical protein